MRALRLFAFTSSVFPSEWGETWNETIVPDLLEFGFHARKVNEFCGFKDAKFSDAGRMLVRISENDPGNWERNYNYALNLLMHMTSFVIGQTHADHRRIFLKSEANLSTTYVTVKTDRFPESSISIYGLVDCFLTDVIIKIKNEFPEIRF